MVARGWKACGGFLSAKEIAVVFDAYRQSAEDAGHEHGPEQIAVRRMVTFVDEPSQQRDAVKPFDGFHRYQAPKILQS